MIARVTSSPTRIARTLGRPKPRLRRARRGPVSNSSRSTARAVTITSAHTSTPVSPMLLFSQVAERSSTTQTTTNPATITPNALSEDRFAPTTDGAGFTATSSRAACAPGRCGAPVRIVHVGFAFPLEPLGVDPAQPALGRHPHADLAGQPHRRLADPALYAGGEVPLVTARKVHRRLPGPHGEVQPRQVEAIQVQVALPGAHLHAEVDRHLVVEAQVPLVARVAAEADALAAALFDAQLAGVAAHLVVHLGLPRGDVVGEVALHQRVGPAGHVELAGAHPQLGADGLSVLQIHRPRLALQFAHPLRPA